MLDEAGAALLVADAGNRALAAELASGARQILDIDAIDPASRSDDLALPLSPDRGAYIFYTSGSTGRPKGVVDTHRNVLHNVMRYTNSLAIGPEDRLSLVQSSTFSGTVSSVFGALANGAALVPFDLRREGTARLADWVARERITIFHSVPAIFRAFVDGGRRYPDLRLVRLEGDRALRLDVELFRKHFADGCLLVNGLGATETGLVRQFFVDRDTELARQPRSGRAIPSKTWTCRFSARTAHPRRPGRSARSRCGAAFSREATGASRISTDRRSSRTRRAPASARTGLATSDACSRTGVSSSSAASDRALKIRGVRVEPAETERAILEIEGVSEAAVAARPDRSGEERLTAYIVPSTPRAPTPAALRRLLSATLPDASVPTRFVTLPALPLDAHGKLDRDVLPDPKATGDGDATTGPPRDRLERQLFRLWVETLGVERLGVRDDFFELGGDSLMAMRIAAGAERLVGFRVAPSLLVEAPTIESLAAALREESRRKRSAEPVVALEVGGPGARPPLFFSPSRDQIGPYGSLARRLGTAQPLYLVRWMRLRNGALPESVEEMAEHTVREIRRVQPHGPYRLGGFCFGGVVALEAARQLRAVGEMIALLALVGVGPFDFPGLVSSPPSVPSVAAPPGSALARLRLAAGRARARARTSGADFVWRAASRALRVTGLAFPERLRDADRVSRRAHAVYVARPDPGPVALFLAERRGAEDPASDYRGLSTAALEIHELPVRDTPFFAEPAVGALAKSLGEALARRGEEAGRAISRRP